MHLHKGKEYFDQNQLQKAREELEAAYHLRPQEEKVLNLLGMAYFKLEMLPQAEEMYATLASNNPDVYTLQSNLGLIRLKLDKLDLAEESLTRALELMPGNQKAHFYLGLLYEKWQKWEKALPHFEHAKADKMVEKIKHEIEEEKKRAKPPEKEPEMLAFEVLEVLEEKPAAIFAPVIPPVVPDEITERLRLLKQTAPPPPAAPVRTQTTGSFKIDPLMQKLGLTPSPAVTGKMLKTDVQDALSRKTGEFKLPEPPPPPPPPAPAVVEEGGADTLFEEGEDLSKLVEEEPEPTPVAQEVAVAAPAPPPPPVPEPPPPLPVMAEEDEEELVPDEGPHDAPAVIEEGHIEEEEPLWEKTQPKLTVSSPPAEALSEVEKTGPIAAPAGLFSAEDMAADISTFLAESRVEGPATTPDFVQEPPAPPEPVAEELSPESEVLTEPVVEEPRIPSPQEVENETRDMGEEPLFVKQEEEPEVLQDVIEPEVAVATPEAPPVIVPEASIVAPEPVKVEEPEPVPVEPVTPPVPPPAPVVAEAVMTLPVDRTQMMPMPPPPEPMPEVPAVAAVEMPPPVVEAPALSAVAEAIASETAAADLTRSAKAAAPTAGGYQPANLDQFSRDRFYVQPLIGSDRFLLIDPHLLEIIVSDRIFCRRGTISSFSGSVQFAPWPNLEEEILVEVSGSGILFLADRRKEIFLISLNNESLLVESTHLLVAQSVLKIETKDFKDEASDRSYSMFQISGRGTVALTCQTKPLTLNVHESMPVNIPADALIALSGHVNSEVMKDEELRKILMTAEEGTTFLRLTGSGDVVVEQGSLWGDRRAKR